VCVCEWWCGGWAGVQRLGEGSGHGRQGVARPQLPPPLEGWPAAATCAPTFWNASSAKRGWPTRR
jgi:hypothetical protein